MPPRPPERLRTPSINERSGRFFVRSEKSDTLIWRRPGDVGLYTRTGISDSLEELDRLALGQPHDRLLPRRAIAHELAHTPRLARHPHRAHVGNLHREQLLDGA